MGGVTRVQNIFTSVNIVNVNLKIQDKLEDKLEKYLCLPGFSELYDTNVVPRPCYKNKYFFFF